MRSMRFRAQALFLSVGAMAMANPAHATVCTYSGATVCTSSGVNICVDNSGTDVTCNVTSGTTNSAGATLTAVTIGTQIEIWGTDADGVNQFCCPMPIEPHLYVYGGAHNDQIDMNYNGGTLEHLGATVAHIYGYAGDDLLSGSDNGSAGVDWIYGGNGNDTIHGLYGADYLYGEDGVDTMYGGDGADYMSGGNDHDIMAGEGGDDAMDGDGDIDFMAGGNGDDDMDGGNGGDVMCGDAESTNGDLLDDGDVNTEATPDALWAAGAADWDTCQGGGTTWDGAAGTGGCGGHTVIYARPGSCP